MDPASFDRSMEIFIVFLGIAIDTFGVAIIVVGIVWSTLYFLVRQKGKEEYHCYKARIGRSLLLGLELLVAADIVKTIALDATLQNLGVLAGLVAIRTFLSWSIVVEIDGVWPWQIGRHTAQRKHS